MQGLWKDKRKHFLKDKVHTVYKNYNRNRLRKDVIESIVVDTEDKAKRMTEFSYKTVQKIPVEKITFYRTIERRKPFDFKKCNGCPSSCLNKEEKFDEYGRVINRKEICELSILKEKYFMNKGSEVIEFYKNHKNGFCVQFQEDLFYEEESFTCLAYYSERDKCYKDFYSKEEIKRGYYGKKHKNFFTNKYVFEEVTIILTKNDFTRWYKEELSIYNEPVDSYFYHKYTTYGRRKKVCRTFANRKARTKSKEWLIKVKKDVSFLDKEPFPKNFPNEKSVKWCVS